MCLRLSSATPRSIHSSFQLRKHLRCARHHVPREIISPWGSDVDSSNGNPPPPGGGQGAIQTWPSTGSWPCPGAAANTWKRSGQCPAPWSPGEASPGRNRSGGQGMTGLVPTESVCPCPHPGQPTKAKLPGTGVGGYPAGSAPQHPARLLASNSHGYREIFIPSRWAPGATAAEHAATSRKPSHPRDKDSCMTQAALALQRQPGAGARGWPEPSA